jgi:hypothetical protein
LLDYALGELGILPGIFWELTPAEYVRIARGYEVRQAREWDRARHIVAMIHNVNASKNERKTPAQLYPLPLVDPKPKQYTARVWTEEEIQARLKRDQIAKK